jgi:hypothetical protein
MLGYRYLITASGFIVTAIAAVGALLAIAG